MAGAGRVDVHVVWDEVEGEDDGTIRIAVYPSAGSGGDGGWDGAGAGEYGDVLAVGPDFTRAVLDVAGAVLTWPVLGDPGPPSAHVHDPGRAQQWLWALYGEGVAAAVHDCATREPGGVPTREPGGARVAADPTALAGCAARLAFAHWAARWWPASYADGIPALEPDVLGLETAALTHRCQQLFDDEGDQPDDCAAELITEHQAALDPLIQWWRATPRPAVGTALHLEGVLRLIDDAADGAGLDGPALRHLGAALQRPGPTGAPADPGALFARHDGYALAAGEPLTAGGRVIARGTGTNDWRRYPPGLVDATESAVSWTVRALGARRRIEVEVVAHGAAPATGTSLVAEVHVNGDGPHRVPLSRRDDMWAGRSGLDAAMPSEIRAPRIEAGVLLPGFDPGPGTSGGAEDRVGRDAVRALVRRRLTAATQPPAHGGSPYNGSPYETCSAPFLAETVAAAATDADY
ncbi:hypothetical protein F9278_05155 [Streptomyces phaeolivaceus]|uniref:Uncharacterized protein n=1 Tax=Streptomyces phaeolivaceus TaxID=2653200 RepID=A0A5P8JZ17_9ACTN|nr:hypothetical protein [Streptomyces phaeolivaceus]QFQ95669.1 hypothetical protein F9278_05155 [Streptomyces phaeolivaceus]